MKFEDCSKDELIHFIRTECLQPTEKLEFCILMYRSDKAIDNERKASQKASEALNKYTEHLKPYEGKLLSDIPDSVFKKVDSYYKTWELEKKKSNRYHKEWERLQKLIDKALT